MLSSIRGYLQQHRSDAAQDDFSDDESLLDAGIIDSMVMVDLIAFLEQEFQIRVEEDEMTPENFDSVAAIVDYVRTKSTA